MSRQARRGYVVAGALIVGAIGANWALGLDGIDGDTGRPTDHTQNVVVYEDGSGVQYVGDQEVRTFPEGTFVWDCRTMGNKVCGPGQ